MRRPLLLAAVLAAIVAPSAQAAETLHVLNSGSIFAVNADTGGTLASATPVTGLGASETPVAIDLRP